MNCLNNKHIYHVNSMIEEKTDENKKQFLICLKIKHQHIDNFDLKMNIMTIEAYC